MYPSQKEGLDKALLRETNALIRLTSHDLNHLISQLFPMQKLPSPTPRTPAYATLLVDEDLGMGQVVANATIKDSKPKRYTPED